MTRLHFDAPRVRLEDLATIRALVARACADAGAPDAVCEALVLATDEVCSNVVLHGYGASGAGPVRVEVDVAPAAAAGAAATVTITDGAPPFDVAPDGAAPDGAVPDLDAPWNERAIGGLGLFFVRQLMDEVRYERQPAGNSVTLVKRLAPPQT